MNIWELLEIEPTTDKKAIRRAYAARTRVIHPEEKPEEFKLLHKAYEAALQFAEFAAQGGVVFEGLGGYGTQEDVSADENIDRAAEQPQNQEESEHSELLSFFTENQLKQKQRIDAFVQQWKELKNPGGDSEESKRWKEYLDSEDFKSIQWNPRIVKLIAEEMDDKFFYSTNEMKIWFWEAYGFQADDKDKYQGEQQKLWECLYPAYEYFQKVLLARQYERENKRAFRIFLAMVFAGALFLGVIALAYSYHKRGNERALIEQYMSEQYPGTEFSVPEKSRQKETSGVAYNLYAFDHPDLLITAKVEYPYQDGGRTCVMAGEDYGVQLLEYYAAQYGLLCGRTEYTEAGYDFLEKKLYSVLFYPDIEQVDTFCETVTKMFDEQEELRAIQSVGICEESVLFPEVLLQGGVDDFPFDDPQMYDLGAMSEQELTAQIKEAYIIYMFQYEFWNLTMQQCREWGAVYQEACWQWQDYRGLWYDMTDLHTGDILCTIYVSTYMHDDYRHSLPYYEESVTVGNAYVLLLIQGVDVSVNEDGSGFTAEIDGKTETFGSEPEVRIDKLGALPNEMQNQMQNNFFILK